MMFPKTELLVHLTRIGSFFHAALNSLKINISDQSHLHTKDLHVDGEREKSAFHRKSFIKLADLLPYSLFRNISLLYKNH